jgi:methionyl-tRNA formyltransferase
MMSFLVIGDGEPARAAISASLSASATPGLSLLTPGPAKVGLATFARSNGVEVLDADFVRESSASAWVRERHFDWLISVNNLVIIPHSILRLFAGRAVNCHPGILPEYAGVHVHQWAIRNGEQEFGVTLHKMEEQVDGGAILDELRFAITSSDTGLSLFAKCMRASAKLITTFISGVLQGNIPSGRPQCLCRRRVYRAASSMDGRIDWSWPAKSIVDFVRAGNYEPFTSPSYTARLIVGGNISVDILCARPVGPARGSSGHLHQILPSGPIFTCGGGEAIQVTRARRGLKMLTEDDWRSLADRGRIHELFRDSS